MDLVLILLLNEENENVNRGNYRMRNRQLRDASDPFSLPEENFRQFFRLSKAMTRNLCELLTPFLPTDRITAVSPTIKILSSLFFYAHGSYQKPTGLNYLFGLSQASVSRCLNTVTDVICTHLLGAWVKFPISIEEKQYTKVKFYEKFQFAGIIGVIDCTHIAIVSPLANDEQFPGRLYLNRKNYHSINVQVICDAELKLLAVNSRYPGSVHDAAIWSTSDIRHHLIQQYTQGERSSWLLGDSGYPLEPWLFTPIIGAAPGTPQNRYNVMLKSARNTIERCIGILKMRFRCLLKHRTLHYDPVTAGKIVYACCVLHNMCIKSNIPEPPVDEDYDDIEEIPPAHDINDANEAPQQGNWLNKGQIIRNRFINNLH